MIENLNGIFETVNYKKNTTLRLYDNDQYEDYPAHWHTEMEIIMPTENIYTIECADKKTVIREGDILFICPGCVHTLYAPETGRRIIFQPNTYSLGFTKDIETVIGIISPMMVITPEEYPVIHPMIRDQLLAIRDEYLEDQPYMELDICSKFLKIMTLIGRNHVVANDEVIGAQAKQSEYIEKFLSVCDYISEHCNENLTLEDAADMCGFSKFYFSRLFKQFTKVTFYKYVNQKRIHMAAQLLIEPKNSITDVALNCGFSSISSFIRMFKIIKGCTPSEFRSMYTGQDHKWPPEPAAKPEKND